MIDIVKRFFGRSASDGSTAGDFSTPHDIRVAVCALFIEIARIDNCFSPQELDTLLSILKAKYNLSEEHAEALLDAAGNELEESVDLWHFAKLINDNYTIDEKVEVIEMLWQIVYVDGKMDEHEHYLMNKLSNLLRLSHKQMIDAKIKVLRND